MDYNIILERINEKSNKDMDISSMLDDKELLSDKCDDILYNGWFTYVYINIKNYQEVVYSCSKQSCAKYIRIFYTEILNILNSEENIVDSGLTYNDLYAIYTSETTKEEMDIFLLCVKINTLIRYINEKIYEKEHIKIDIGIGMCTGTYYAFKLYGTENVNKRFAKKEIGLIKTENNHSKRLSKHTTEKYKIAISESSYENILIYMGDEQNIVKDWFKSKLDSNGERYYLCNSRYLPLVEIMAKYNND